MAHKRTSQSARISAYLLSITPVYWEHLASLRSRIIDSNAHGLLCNMLICVVSDPNDSHSTSPTWLIIDRICARLTIQCRVTTYSRQLACRCMMVSFQIRRSQFGHRLLMAHKC